MGAPNLEPVSLQLFPYPPLFRSLLLSTVQPMTAPDLESTLHSGCGFPLGHNAGQVTQSVGHEMQVSPAPLSQNPSPQGLTCWQTPVCSSQAYECVGSKNQNRSRPD